ncbi:MAG: hypothetical protein ABIP64_11465 [Burkholderiales bacterium]
MNVDQTGLSFYQSANFSIRTTSTAPALWHQAVSLTLQLGARAILWGIERRLNKLDNA